MADNNEEHSHPTGDRRLQSLVYDLDKKVHALELAGAQYQLQIAHMQGEIVGIRSSTASSGEVQAASKLIGEQIAGVKAEIESDRKLTYERMSQVKGELAAMRRVLWFVGATVAGSLFAAVRWGALFGQ